MLNYDTNQVFLLTERGFRPRLTVNDDLDVGKAKIRFRTFFKIEDFLPSTFKFLFEFMPHSAFN
jgi:hypothetical protein